MVNYKKVKEFVMSKKNLHRLALIAFTSLFFTNGIMAKEKFHRKLVSMKPINSSVSVKPLQRFDPSKQIEGLKGYIARGRQISIPAGGSIPQHEHSKRPGIVYVVSGEIMEYRGKNVRKLVAGDSLKEDFTTVHSFKNIGNQTCVLIAFDIPQDEK